MSTQSVERPPSRPRLREWLAESFWVADAMVIAMFVFFIALGAFSPWETTAVSIALAVLAGLYAIHLWSLHRRRDELQRTPESRMARERRGF